MTANLVLMATLGLAATGAGFLVAPHAAAWVDAALDGCPDAQIGASTHARASFFSKHARAQAHAQAAQACEEDDASTDGEDEEECEREKAERHARAKQDAALEASVDVGVSVSA